MRNHRLIKFIWVFIALSGCFSVLFGAWLAHASSTLLSDDKARLITAHHYQVIHTLSLLGVLIAYRLHLSRALLFSLVFFMLGIVLFSGSLYLKVLGDMTLIGKVTPIGGLLLATGWFSLAFIGKEKL